MQAKGSDRAVSVRKVLRKKPVKRRVEAARLLKGVSQAEMGQAFKADGIPLYLAAEIERGKKKMRASHRRTFAARLTLPEVWFVLSDEELLQAIRDGLEPYEEEFKRRGGFDPESPLAPDNGPPNEQDEDEDQSQEG